MRLPEFLSLCIKVMVAGAMIGGTTLSLVHAENTGTATQPALMDSMSLTERFPTGSIQSEEQANDALQQVKLAQARIKADFAQGERECNPQFFATKCLADAKERRRHATARVHRIELEAKQFKRRLKVTERDKLLAEKRAAEAADTAPLGSMSGAESESENPAAIAAAAANAKDNSGNGGKTTAGKRVVQHQIKLRNLQAAEEADAAKREQNVAAYERKVREAEARQKYIADKKLKKNHSAD